VYKRQTKDHTDRWFKSEREMYAAWDIPPSTAKARKSRGWPLKKILTTPINDDKKCHDHLNNEYPSKTVMCNFYSISVNTYDDRIRNGWTKERALTEKIRDFHVTDFADNVFETREAMCRAYGVTTSTYNMRRANGMTMEEALTTSIDNDSALTKKIKAVLNELKIRYSEDTAFSVLMEDTPKDIKLLRPDFFFSYKNYKYIVEADGTQHFKTKFNCSEKEFEEQRKRDLAKDRFAYGTPKMCIVRIKYNELSKVKSILQDALSNPEYFEKHCSRHANYYS